MASDELTIEHLNGRHRRDIHHVTLLNKWDTELALRLDRDSYPATVLQCVRCRHLHPLRSCPNCAHTRFVRGKIRNQGTGIVCERCDFGWTTWSCPDCGTRNLYTRALGRLVPASDLPVPYEDWRYEEDD